MSMYHFTDAEAIEHDVNTVPDSGDFERVEIDGQWYVPERTCCAVMPPYEPGVEEISVCSECGKQLLLDDDDCYCPRCGAKLMEE